MTLIPRGQAKGLTWFTPGEDQSLISAAMLKASGWHREAGKRPTPVKIFAQSVPIDGSGWGFYCGFPGKSKRGPHQGLRKLDFPNPAFYAQARIAGALGGRAAEQLVFGTDQVTTGASGDLQQAI